MDLFYKWIVLGFVLMIVLVLLTQILSQVVKGVGYLVLSAYRRGVSCLK